MPRCLIFVGLDWIVHANELKDEVRHAGEVEEDDEALARVGFTAREEGGEEEKDDRDGERGDGEDELVSLDVDRDDEELDGVAEEEEEVELEESDVDLNEFIG